jgi:hypothetical protein
VNPLRTTTSLNGWWDFLPVLTEEAKLYSPPGPIPTGGWLTAAIPVPGSWSRGGPIPTPQQIAEKPWLGFGINDSYALPAEWNDTNTAWYRRTFTVPHLQPGRRWVLQFGGILRYSWVYVNGRQVGSWTDGILPCEFDVTGAVRLGDNELVVYVTDFERNEQGKTFVPHGHDQMTAQRGIWQDVSLVSRGDLYADDVTIRTSTRRNELTVILTVANRSDRQRTITPQFEVTEAVGGAHALSFAGPEITVPAGGSATVTAAQPWSGYQAWSPRTPHLYFLRTVLVEGAAPADVHDERFGFREVWTDAHRIMLNGTPAHLWGEWGHKMNFENFRPEYVRQWYRFLKDCNQNYYRSFGYPHPKVLFDLADEMGILIALEGAWQFGTSFALDDERLWQGAMRHIRNNIRRDKNHPCIVMYSTGNEVRWADNQPAIIRNMPRLAALYEQLDPTRIVYSDGSTSLWDEREQHVLSRHYGPECAGDESWWDKSKPLHAGELGKWHYGQPQDNCVWGDDSVFVSFANCHRTIALEAADTIEQARSNEVACLANWNLACLDNYRPWPRERKFDWPDWSAPHLKPLRTGPYVSEFAWWEPDAPGYAPGVSFEIIKNAFRPLAVIVRERLNHVFDDQPIKHTVTVANDTGGTVRGTLQVTMRRDERVLWQTAQPVEIGEGRTHRQRFDIPPQATGEVCEAVIESQLVEGPRLWDRHVRRIRVTPAAARSHKWAVGPVAVFGDGSIDDVLAAHGVEARRVESISKARPDQTPVLVIEKDAVQAGSDQNRQLEAFLRAGGRAVVLEQTASILPKLDLDTKPAERCHMYGGAADVLRGVGPEDLEYWGDMPYGMANSSSWVVVAPYRKPASGATRMLLHSAWGDFGHGGMHWSPLVETRVGDGLVLASQLRLTDRAAVHPSAMNILRNLLEHAASWRAPRGKTVQAAGPTAEYLRGLGARVGAQGDLTVVQAADLDAAGAKALAARVKTGGSAIVYGLTVESAKTVSAAFGIDVRTVELGTIYHFIRARRDGVLDGLSNAETYWLDKPMYGPTDAVNRPMTDILLECPQGQVLLESESESCWREFFTLDGKSERTRMSVVTYYLWDGPRPKAAGLLRAPCGKGELLLCQVPIAADGYRKAGMFWSHILRNLGVAFDGSLIEGDRVAAGSKKSDGYPVVMRYILDPAPEMVERIIHAAAPQEHRLPNHALNSGFAWTKAACQGGQFALPAAAKMVAMTFQFAAGRPRKAMPVEGGWPNPNLQTLMDVYGRGRVRVFFNGREYEPLDLGVEGQATVPDVDAEMEWNTVLLLWTPDPDDSALKLRMLWRNRQRQPEVEFDFDVRP